MGIVHRLRKPTSLGLLILTISANAPLSAAETPPGASLESPPSFRLRLRPTDVGIVLVPLGPKDVSGLDDSSPGPLPSGVTRRLSPLNIRDLSAVSSAAWSQTVSGLVWRAEVTSPDAKALRLHFSKFSIGTGALWVYSETTETFGPYRGRGPFGDGDFWTPIVLGDSVIVEYWPRTSSSVEDMLPFEILELGHLWHLPHWLAEIRSGGKLDGAGPRVWSCGQLRCLRTGLWLIPMESPLSGG